MKNKNKKNNNSKKKKNRTKNNDKKSKSIIISFLIIITTLIFSTLTVISITTPDISYEIKKDLSKGINSLCNGDAKNYYNIYNTRKLTEIEKTKFYDKISDTQNILDSEKELFKKYNLKIQIKEVSIIDKIGDNLFLCNLNVNHKSRVNDKTTKTINKTEDYIVKIIDVGNMDYKILLPFNSLDKDFSSSDIYKALKESSQNKQAEKIKEQRELEEKKKLEEQEAQEIIEETTEETVEHSAVIIEDSSNISNENETNKPNNTNESGDTGNKYHDTSNQKTDNSNKDNNYSSSNNEESNKSAYEEFIGN